MAMAGGDAVYVDQGNYVAIVLLHLSVVGWVVKPNKSLSPLNIRVIMPQKGAKGATI